MPRIIEKELSYKINGLCFKVHKDLGRFCRERQYCDAFENLLKQENIPYQREYQIRNLDPSSSQGNRANFVVKNRILVVFKVKNFITKEDYYQMQRYLSAAKVELGLIVNFRDAHLKPKRVLNSGFFSGHSGANLGNSGRVLGIDYGEKRIGLAISDETQTFAQELDILSPKDFFKQIRNLIKQHQISKIVLGWPLNMRGGETKKTEEIKKFKKKLEKLMEIPIEIIDERLTSVMVKHLPGGDKDIDSLAAQIILQNYLDKTENNE